MLKSRHRKGECYNTLPGTAALKAVGLLIFLQSKNNQRTIAVGADYFFVFLSSVNVIISIPKVSIIINAS